MALKIITVRDINTNIMYNLTVPTHSADSDAYDILNNWLTSLKDNYSDVLAHSGWLPSGTVYNGMVCENILESMPFGMSGIINWFGRNNRIIYRGYRNSSLYSLPAGTYTHGTSATAFVVGYGSAVGTYHPDNTNNLKSINPATSAIATSTFFLGSDYDIIINSESSYSYNATDAFTYIYYNTTTGYLCGYTGYVWWSSGTGIGIGIKGINLYIGDINVLKPKPISPDEVETTNEQVGNDVDYENIHIDVNVITPTDDNEENFSTSTITDTNIVSVYALTNSEVRSFSNYIWTAASQGLWQALSEQLQNPMDVILSLHTIPYANSDGTFVFATQDSNIALAGVDSGIASKKVLKDNFQDFVGSVNLNSFVRHNFVDFPPYTELSIYLPYLGYVDLDLNDFRDRVGDDDSLGLHYIVEPMTGNFVAKITSFKKNYKGAKDTETSSLNGTVMYSFSGNMARQLPLANRHYDILGGIMGIGSSLLMGGAQATMGKKPIGGIVSAVTGTVGSVIDMMTPKVSHSGNLGGNFGYLDSNVARIIMRSTPYYIPSNYGLTTGYVVNSYYSSFKNLLGLVVIENWIPKNMSRATLEEITELEKLLKEGVYFGDGIWNETTEQESD